MAEMKIQVEEFKAEYAGCGSHEIELIFEMSYENMLTWHDRLSRILEGRQSKEEERRAEEERIAQEQRDRGLIA
jgi:hypothetical protein